MAIYRRLEPSEMTNEQLNRELKVSIKERNAHDTYEIIGEQVKRKMNIIMRQINET